MTVTISQVQGKLPVLVLHMHGDLDASTYQALIAKAQEACQGGAKDILLDLSDTSYMSSSGLVALQSIAALVRGEELPDPEAGWEAFRAIDRDRDTGLQRHFKLLNPQPRVDRMLEMVGLKRYLEIYHNLDAALASF